MIDPNNPKVLAKVAAIVERQKEADAIGIMAASDPLPGPAGDAFAIGPNIKVGSFEVQPFLDRHFQMLRQLDNSLYRNMSDATSSDFQPNGPDAWELYWMMTRPVAVTRELLKAGKVQEFKDAAEAEFAELTMSGLMALCQAVRKQIEASFKPVLGYGAAVEGKQNGNPTS